MKTNIIAKIDKKIKLQAQEVAHELGLSLSDLVNVSLRQIIRDKAVSISIVPRMTPYLERIVAQVEKDYRVGKNLSPAFSSGKEMDKYLDSL